MKNCAQVWCLILFTALHGSVSADSKPLQGERGYFGYVATYEEGTAGEGGIRVLEVYDVGPARTAGLLAGDRIFRVNGEPFRFKNDLEMIREFTRFPPGERIVLDLERSTELLQITLIVGRAPQEKRRQLNQWIAASEEWFEGGGIERCRSDRNRQLVYRDLEKRASGRGVVVLVERAEDTSDVQYSTTNEAPPQTDERCWRPQKL